jgi:(p)ppGpp synthase/HD superfamily hydrolase
MHSVTMPFPSREAADRLANEQHAHQTRHGGEPYAAHTQRVADRAAELLTAYYQIYGGGLLVPTDQLQIDSAYCAGRLHDVIEDCGVPFEQLVQTSNLLVATWVAALSQDNRLPLPRRVMEYKGRLFEADLAVQVIKLADVEDNLKGAVEQFRANRAQAKEWFQHWLEVECPDVLSALRKVERYAEEVEELSQAWRWCWYAAQQLTKACRRLAERDSILANIAARQALTREQERPRRSRKKL